MNLNEKNKNNNINLNKNELNSLCKELERDIEGKFKNVYVPTNEITNIEILRYKAFNEYYFNSETFIEDLNSLFKNVYLRECLEEDEIGFQVFSINNTFVLFSNISFSISGSTSI